MTSQARREYFARFVGKLHTDIQIAEAALRTLLRMSKQGEIRRLRGKLDWQGDLNAMRSDR